MKSGIACTCGKVFPAFGPGTGATGACPQCGRPIAPNAVGMAEIRKARQLILSTLAGLVFMSGTVAFTGWLLTRQPVTVLAQSTEKPVHAKPFTQLAVSEPPAPRLAQDHVVASVQENAIAAKTPIVEPPIVEPPIVEPPAGELPLTVADPEPRKKTTEPATIPSPIPGETSPSWSRPTWSMESVGESPSRSPNFIMPIEVARFDEGIPYTIRRLKFPDGLPKPLRIGVTPFVYDDMAPILARLGDGYRFTDVKNEDLYSYSAIKSFDVLFLTCAEPAPPDVQAIAPLRKFVEMGGTLYASDLRCDLLLKTFPEFRARTVIFPGIQQTIDAAVVEKGLQTYLGRQTIPLALESPDWRPAAFDPARVIVCLKGLYRNKFGQVGTVPLMVKFRVQRGTVIFTSFHNSRNDTEVVRKLLEYQVFSTVNARSEARIRDLLEPAQLAAPDLRPLLLSYGKSPEIQHQHKGGPLQIALGFENLGARLKLVLRAPNGKTIEHEERGLYSIEVPNAPAGNWSYTIVPLELPYPRFPIVAGIGTGKS